MGGVIGDFGQDESFADPERQLLGDIGDFHRTGLFWADINRAGTMNDGASSPKRSTMDHLPICHTLKY
jgi:hypothetical protein